jgi:hypothetical protein
LSWVEPVSMAVWMEFKAGWVDPSREYSSKIRVQPIPQNSTDEPTFPTPLFNQTINGARRLAEQRPSAGEGTEQVRRRGCERTK